MAIDTRDERASCLGVGLVALRVWPNPSGDLSGRGKRQHMAGLFAGTAIVAVAEGGVSPFRRVRLPPRWVELEARPFVEPILWGAVFATQEAEHEARAFEEAEAFGIANASVRLSAQPAWSEERGPVLRLRVRVKVAGMNEIETVSRALAVRQPSRSDILMAMLRIP